MKGIIIAGFAGVGKTTLAKKYKNVIDLESSTYRWDNSELEDIPTEERKGTVRKPNESWPENYISAIKNSQSKYDIVLVWIHPDVLKIYEQNNIQYTLCYPNKDSLHIYRQRYIDRGNNEHYVSKVTGSYDMRFEQFKALDSSGIILEGEQTLEDYLLSNHYNLTSE